MDGRSDLGAVAANDTPAVSSREFETDAGRDPLIVADGEQVKLAGRVRDRAPVGDFEGGGQLVASHSRRPSIAYVCVVPEKHDSARDRSVVGTPAENQQPYRTCGRNGHPSRQWWMGGEVWSKTQYLIISPS
jgi:hypothetical protein